MKFKVRKLSLVALGVAAFSVTMAPQSAHSWSLRAASGANPRGLDREHAATPAAPHAPGSWTRAWRWPVAVAMAGVIAFGGAAGADAAGRARTAVASPAVISQVLQQHQGGVAWPLSQTHITSGFGHRSSGMHYGVDLPAPRGTAVTAATSGTVVQAYTSSTYGRVIYIKDGDVETRYAHLSAMNVRVGDMVWAGQTIGTVGNSGRVNPKSFYHLHFEVRVQDRAVDPAKLLR